MLVSLYANHNSMIKVGKIVGDRIGNAYTFSNDDSFTISRQTAINYIRSAKMFDVTVPKQETPATIYYGGREVCSLKYWKE